MKEQSKNKEGNENIKRMKAMKGMKHIPIILCTLSSLMAGGTVLGQERPGIEGILQQIELHNRELQAATQLARAEKLEQKSSNNLPDPTLSYAHLWDSKDKNITVGELVVSQSFDFPTRYLSRGGMNRHLYSSIDAATEATRQRILLEAKLLCIEITTLNRQQKLLKERMEQAEKLAKLYQKRLQEGDANLIETNKIELERLNARTEYRLGEIAILNKTQQLLALNGNQPLLPGRPTPLGPAIPTADALGLDHFNEQPLPGDLVTLMGELMETDPSLRALKSRQLAAEKSIGLNKQGWLPRLELGYRRNTESGHPLNGVVVGFSFPLFENRSKVKSARSQATGLKLQREDALDKEQARLSRLYEEAYQLQQSISEYQNALSAQQNLTLLEKALMEGQISLIDYFVEVSIIYQSQSNLFALEGEYQRAVAELYRSRL